MIKRSWKNRYRDELVSELLALDSDYYYQDAYNRNDYVISPDYSRHKCCPLVVSPLAVIGFVGFIAAATAFLNQRVITSIGRKRKRRELTHYGISLEVILEFFINRNSYSMVDNLSNESQYSMYLDNYVCG